MAWKCDVCGENIHLVKKGKKNFPVRCPLEKFKNVKLFYTPEIKPKMTQLFFDCFTLSNQPADLKNFSEQIPNETPLMDYIRKVQDPVSKDWSIYTRTLIIESTEEGFFTNFTRVLMEVYDDNTIHFVDSPQLPKNNQFNYLWLSPTTLRLCYFGEGGKEARFKSMSDLGNPSLVVYPIGDVCSVKHSAWGDILLDMITHRASMGKPVWIIKTKSFSDCPEIESSEKLRTYLTKSSTIPTVELDSDGLIDNREKKPNKTIGNYKF